MAGKLKAYWERQVLKRALLRWRRAADLAESAPVEDLYDLRRVARSHRRQIDRLLHVAEGRLAHTLVNPAVIRRPPGADWVWRPDLWSGPLPSCAVAGVMNQTRLCEGATVFHDCPASEITARQTRNWREEDMAPCGLSLDILHFDGNFLSLVLDLPEAAIQGLRAKHLIRLETIVDMERPLEIFARLNVKHGPNVEQIVREIPLTEDEVMVEFDMFYTKLNEKRVEKAWIDLIFEGPAQNRIVIRDVTVSRRPRAEL